MQVLALSTLRAFWERHPDARRSLERWYTVARAAHWRSMDDVKSAFSTAKGLNDERMRFEVAGGNYRMIVAFYFPDEIAFIKFIGTHAEYGSVDVLTVSRF
jgi:mRNA interferase HigB